VRRSRFIEVDRDDFVVGAFVVAHLHRADRSRADPAHRFDGLLSEHENVERIAVVAVRLRRDLPPPDRLRSGLSGELSELADGEEVFLDPLLQDNALHHRYRSLVACMIDR